MTLCSEQLTFSFYQDKDLTADLGGGQISSDTGLLTLRALDEKLGWLTEAASVLSDPRDPDRTRHKLLPLLRQRVFGMIGGYEDCNDHDRMRNDPVLKLTCDRGPEGGPLASQPTLSRFENWTGARDVARLNRLLVAHWIRLHKDDPPEELILDVDPTDDGAPEVQMQFPVRNCQVARGDPCHGHQQLALFNGFYDQRMYFPLLIFERGTGMLLGERRLAPLLKNR